MNNTYVNIDLDAILHNFHLVSQKAGVPVMAVIKANAYGHGSIPVGKLLEPECDFFGVSSVGEALELRRADIQKPILVLGYTPASLFPQVVRENIRPSIFNWEDACALSCEAQKQGKTAPFHFAVDTGMSRIGFQPTSESAAVCKKIAELPNLFPEGLFSHFAAADDIDLTSARAQAQRFDRFDTMLREQGVAVKIRHLDNSAGIFNFDCHYEMVRAGIVLYGLHPSEVFPRLPLKPALSWHTYIHHIKTLPVGRAISYGGTFVTNRTTKVATLPVGYADGYQRCLSNRFYVMIRGQKAPILGRVCMDQLMVDVTDIPDLAPGEPVVLLGEGISADAIADAMGTICYEVVCLINRRVTRRYYREGKLTQTVDYLI